MSSLFACRDHHWRRVFNIGPIHDSRLVLFGEPDAGNPGAFTQQLILNLDVPSDRVGLAGLLMVKISARRSRQLVLARGEPRLGDTALLKIVRRRTAPIFVGTHPGSSALELRSFQRRATAKASKTSHSLLSA